MVRTDFIYRLKLYLEFQREEHILEEPLKDNLDTICDLAEDYRNDGPLMSLRQPSYAEELQWSKNRVKELEAKILDEQKRYELLEKRYDAYKGLLSADKQAIVRSSIELKKQLKNITAKLSKLNNENQQLLEDLIKYKNPEHFNSKTKTKTN